MTLYNLVLFNCNSTHGTSEQFICHQTSLVYTANTVLKSEVECNNREGQASRRERTTQGCALPAQRRVAGTHT